jgi:hypothetical protein
MSYMQPQRTAMTDCLADVIQIIQMGEKSGMLTVERGENRTFEEGFIRFISGRIAEAGTNQQSGMTAFTYLNSWQVCRFSFIAQIPNDVPLPLRSTQPLPANRDLANTVPVANTRFSDPKAPVDHDDRLYVYRDVLGSRFTIPLRLQAGEEVLQRPENTASLPRIHRRLLMLINGQRSISELARLISRSIEETQSLLDDLERSNFIQQ